MNLYFRRHWQKTRDDTYNHWGKSIWYFETTAKGDILRQMEVYENGRILKYSQTKMEDKYGFLEKRPLDLPNFQSFQIKRIDFEKIWIRNK